MKHRLIALAVGAQLLLCTLPSFAEETLQVFLQGSSAPELAQLVSDAGGNVTHNLPIIDAVGAKLSGTQLDKVLESPLVGRFIDDLSDSELPGEKEEEEKPPCRVRGHIELDFVEAGINWRLYNKHPEPAQMDSLNLDWPDNLGEITSIRVGDTTIPKARYAPNKESALKLEFPKAKGPIINEIATLEVRFSKSAEVAKPKQSEFKLDASFAGPCSTDLVPGYENNHEDYYYNTVGGVDALHLQGITGKGVTVAVIDSGLWEHESLVNDTKGKNRLVARYDALTDTEGQEVVDESGHGTHMASIIANSSKTRKNGKWTGTYKGVAPDVNIVAVKVLDREGLAHLLDIVQAVQWVVENRVALNIRVLNLSFAQIPRWPYWQDPVNQAVTQAWTSGITVVAASGNDGPNAMTIGSPGNLPEIITVGAVTDSWTPNNKDDDYIPEFTSRGPTPAGHVKPDIVSFGGHITGLIHPESAIVKIQPEDILRTGEFVSTGSSQAAAFIAGIVALLVELEPALTPNQLKCKLVTSAEPAISSAGTLEYSFFQQGFGMVGATRAAIFGDKSCHSNFFQFPRSPEDLLGPALIGQKGEASLPGLERLAPRQSTGSLKSGSRKWGVKDYIESLDQDSLKETVESYPNSVWRDLYAREKATVENLSGQSPPTD